MFKLLVQGLARKHGLAGSFMAKPYADQAGNGLHTHFSILDQDGANVFADGSEEGTPLLRTAVAGCLKGLADLNLIFAPHANSYERLVPGAHAPTSICWGYDNRTAAIRIPGGSPKARRVEHRLAGGDVSPHLFLAAVLGSALIGIEQEFEAPAPMTGNAYDQDFDQVPTDWAQSIEIFAQSELSSQIFDQILIDNLVRTKRQEMKTHETLSEQERILSYLDRV
jgi:glutamine synthetase